MAMTAAVQVHVQLRHTYSSGTRTARAHVQLRHTYRQDAAGREGAPERRVGERGPLLPQPHRLQCIRVQPVSHRRLGRCCDEHQGHHDRSGGHLQVLDLSLGGLGSNTQEQAEAKFEGMNEEEGLQVWQTAARRSCDGVTPNAPQGNILGFENGGKVGVRNQDLAIFWPQIAQILFPARRFCENFAKFCEIWRETSKTDCKQLKKGGFISSWCFLWREIRVFGGFSTKVTVLISKNVENRPNRHFINRLKLALPKAIQGRLGMCQGQGVGPGQGSGAWACSSLKPNLEARWPGVRWR